MSVQFSKYSVLTIKASTRYYFLFFRHWVITFPFLMYLSIILLLVVYASMYLMNASDMTDEPMPHNNTEGFCRHFFVTSSLMFIKKVKSQK